jgi:hypothetical protein
MASWYTIILALRKWYTLLNMYDDLNLDHCISCRSKPQITAILKVCGAVRGVVGVLFQSDLCFWPFKYGGIPLPWYGFYFRELCNRVGCNRVGRCQRTDGQSNNSTLGAQVELEDACSTSVLRQKLSHRTRNSMILM